MSEKLQVEEAAKLLDFLSLRLSTWSRSTLKQRLQLGCVCINGVISTRHNYPLQAGDTVEVLAAPKVPGSFSSHLEILYSDRDLIAINKPAGLLSVGTEKETKEHALAMLRNQLSSRSKDTKLWPVHRLDRDTSGVLLFATSHEMREAVMAKWDRAEKTYLAIVNGHPQPAEGTIDQPLRHDERQNRMQVGPHPEAKTAITHYRTERISGDRALLNVRLENGRQHQIRAHLAWLGYPVEGDFRYGKPGERLGLHALSLKIIKPGNNKELLFSTPAPADFLSLLTLREKAEAPEKTAKP